MLEVIILSANVLLPLGMMCAAWLLLRLKPFRSGKLDSPSSDDSPRTSSLAQRMAPASLVVLVGCLAFAAAFLVRVEAARSVWPEDAWARIPHAVLLVGAASLLALWIPYLIPAWIVRAIALFFAARMIIPGGEGWEDVAAEASTWLAIIVGGTLLAWGLVGRLPRRWPGVLGLAWIASVVAAAYLSQDFLRVTEPLLAVATVLGMASLMCLARGNPQLVAAVTGPTIFAMSAAVANAQFNSFMGLPNLLSWLAITAPGVAALTTLTVPSASVTAPAQARWKAAVVIVACIALAAAVIAWTIFAGGGVGGDGEEW